MYSPLLTLPAILLALPAVLAGFSQGTVNLTRDYAIEYSGYANTAAFCTEFRNQCVTYNGRIRHHHQVDCVFAQPGPVVRAFCGGVPRDIFGNLPPKGGPVDAYTVQMIGLVHGAKIVGPPVIGTAPIASTTPTPKHSTTAAAPLSVSTRASHTSSASALSVSHAPGKYPVSKAPHPTPTHKEHKHKVHHPKEHKPHKSHPKSIHKSHKRVVFSEFGLCKKWKKQCEDKAVSLHAGHHSYCKTHLLDFVVTEVSCFATSPNKDLTEEVIKALYLKKA